MMTAGVIVTAYLSRSASLGTQQIQSEDRHAERQEKEIERLTKAWKDCEAEHRHAEDLWEQKRDELRSKINVHRHAFHQIAGQVQVLEDVAMDVEAQLTKDALCVKRLLAVTSKLSFLVAKPDEEEWAPGGIGNAETKKRIEAAPEKLGEV